MVVAAYRLSGSDAPGEVRDVVARFYGMEQESDFGGSWELFHPYRKERFAKSNYIQERNHVFMQHFDVTTFDVSVGQPERLTDWAVSEAEGAPVFAEVYKVPVMQHYKSKFGTFDLVQDVYVARNEEAWSVLWAYR